MAFTSTKSESDDSEYYSVDSDNMEEDAGNCIVSDAIHSTKSISTPKKLCDNDIVIINNLLDINEKVSLIYLLYDDSDAALNQIIKLLQGGTLNVLDEWFKVKQNMWQEKLLEALTIIQNYEILRKLGFKKDDMFLRFLPMQYYSSLFIKIVRKCCYRVCEHFDKKNTRNFLYYIEQDFKTKKLKYTAKDDKHFNTNYLEMYFLYLEINRYIGLDDIQNLPKIFKYMDLENLYDDFQKLSDKLINKSENENAGPNHKVDKTPGLEKSDDNPNDNVLINECTSDVYSINRAHPGLLLIINNEDFHTEFRDEYLDKLPPTLLKLDNRKGSETDERKLKETFAKRGFDIKPEKNKVHLEMLEVIKDVVKNFAHSSLFVAILSHGDQGVVYGANSIPVEISKIQEIMCQTHMRSIPKVLLLQSCQGSECQKVADDDLEIDGPKKRFPLPKTTDLLTFRATIAGYGAVRHKKDGTWFIQTLCDMMQKYPKAHFQEICTKVIRDVSGKSWNGKCMVPIMETTFTKDLYLEVKRN